MLRKYRNIINKLFYTLINNPGFFFKRIFFRLRAFILPLPESPVLKRINGIVFEFDFDYNARIKRMYFSTYQSDIVEILKTYLKKGDIFIDVGASIGYFSALAAGLVESEGEVHSFEPVNEYCQKLKKLVNMNSQYKIFPNQFALGNEEKFKKIYIPGLSYIGGNTFFPDLLGDIEVLKAIEVPIRRLDKYIKERKINNIKLIKIDVEGFEFPVLKGLSDYFSECHNKHSYPLIICEICPDSHQGYKLQDLFDYMKRFSYYPFELINTKKRIDINKVIKKKQEVDVLFKNI